MSPDDVFLAAGRALAQIHRFEHNLKGLASLVHSIHNAGETEPVVDFSGSSLGPLIDSVRRLVQVDPNFEDLLEEARLRRNHLCHAYFHDHSAELGTEEGQGRLVQDLQSSELLFDRIADLTTDILGRLIKALDAQLGTA
ncbi:hypothetical protein EON82_15510 [bacterium]|nr:MAG: hypothetical protein EON82_15510 [bacterium]